MSSGPCFVSGSGHGRLGGSPSCYSPRVRVLNYIGADRAQGSTFDSLMAVAVPLSWRLLARRRPRTGHGLAQESRKAAFAAVGGHRGVNRCDAAPPRHLLTDAKLDLKEDP